MDRKADNDNKYKYKWWQIILLAIGIFLDIVGVGLFRLSLQFGTKTADYTKTQEAPIPLQGESSLALADQHLYVFSEYNCSLNVFDANNGEFCYSLSAPVQQNGQAEFIIRDGWTLMWDRNGTLYKYSPEGTFVGRAYFDYFRTDRDYIYLTDSDDKLLAKIPTGTDKIPYNCLDFDGTFIQYNALYDENEKYIVASYNYVKHEESVREYDPVGSDPLLSAVRALDGELIIPTVPLYDKEGHVFTVLFGRLCKDDQVLYETFWLDWIKGYPLLGWFICAVGTGIVGIITSVHNKKRAKKEKARDKELLRSFLPKE